MSNILQQDPFSAYSIEDLLAVDTPSPPADFAEFWQQAYANSITVEPKITLQKSDKIHGAWRVHEIAFTSIDNFNISGWLLLPIDSKPAKGFVVGHGYGGREGPDFHLPFPDAAIFFPCFRGLSKSAKPPISKEPYWHVLHDIDKKDRYILKGCVEDLWLSISALEQLVPEVIGKIGYLGTSFGGGIGALALAQENRIARAHFNAPTFGNHRLRLRLATSGSGQAVQDFFKRHPSMLLRTLRYYDAANAAELIKIPVHFALALRDPVVTPPGQFAIYNQVKSEKQLFVLEAGHEQYANQSKQENALLLELHEFFKPLSL